MELHLLSTIFPGVYTRKYSAYIQLIYQAVFVLLFLLSALLKYQAQNVWILNVQFKDFQ
jgi:hypothetical protein